MPVRLRITFLFAALVFIILSIVCGGIYYFSYSSRMDRIKTRLTNRAITTARFISQAEIFDLKLVSRIDSLTTITLMNKTVQVYDYQNRKIYGYSDRTGDTLPIDHEILDEARIKESMFFRMRNKEVVAYHYTDQNARIVIISAGEDYEGLQYLHSLFNILFISFFTGILIALASGYIFSRELLLPIKRITDDVVEISAQNLTRRIKTGHTKDEWYHFSFTLNELLNRLQESFDLQRRFISNASHELSTPLTSISSPIDVSLQRQREAGEYRKVMQSINQDVRHMGKLTQTLLEFAKASGNAGGLDINLVRIDEVLLRLPAEIGRISSDYILSLQFEQLPEDEEMLLVFGNEPLLLTAIKNIALNACKYSDNQTARVTLKVEGDEILVIVSDQGRGIPSKEIFNIFQPFYRVEENRSAGGFGLGLSLADRIIKLHKGSIELQSELDKGTEFIIRLPAARTLK